MTIHKEGYKILTITVVSLTLINIILFFSVDSSSVWLKLVLLASAIIFLLFLQFFRSPKIVTKIDPKLIYAPADGKIVVIEETKEKEYLDEKRIQVSIFMSPINVHINRNPVSGMVKYFKYHPGQYLVAWHPKASTENERTTIVYELENGLLLLIRQIAGAVARRIKCYINEGDQVVQGEQMGFIKFGSRVDLFIPLDANILVSINDTTTAGKTVIAELN